jgi:glycosyltransferase involved in cell wall biosynthesis
VSPNRIAVIHNGIAIEDEDHGFTVLNARVVRQELRLPESGPIIISVGRLTRQKGHEYLVRAAPTIIQQMPDARIVVVGDGRLRSDLESMAVSGKVEHCVKFVGERTDVNRLLAIADLFVLPSLWESFPFSVLEAMAASLPVVASSVDGLPEVVVRGQTGLLVAPGDANQLASAVIFLLTNPKLALSLGDAGRKRVQTEFPVQKMVRQTEEVYEACLA